ncbi:MAG: hypothetical protein QUS14_08185 [Pyrinomonadaceae bacterium]|nr:hypothetical protein [Pyrinomonadaceae bacterium]
MLSLPEKRKGVFIVGLTLTVVFSILIGLLHFGVLYLFGVPFLGIFAGIVLIWYSQISRAAKFFISVLPLPLIISSFFLFLYLRTAEGEDFVVPAAYQGEIVVFYNEPCGTPVHYERGRRIYEIPNEGVLITQGLKNEGYHDRKFYIRQSDGILDEIPIFGRQDFETEKKEWGTYTRATQPELTLDTVGAFWSHGRETYFLSRDSIGYTVSTYREFSRDAKERAFEQKEFTGRAEALLIKCRQGS